MDGYRHILVPVDFSKHSEEAVRAARTLAKTFDGKMELLHVIDQRYAQLGYGHAFFPIEENAAQLREIALQRFAEFKEALDLDDSVELNVLAGVPFDVVLERAQKGDVDLIVMGTHGHTGVSRFIMGSQSESVVRRSPIPVLVVHAHKD